MAVEPTAPGPAAAAPGGEAMPAAAAAAAAPAPAAVETAAPAAVAAPAPATDPAPAAPAADAAAGAPGKDAAAAPDNDFKPSVLDAAAAGDKAAPAAAADKTKDAKPADTKAGEAKPGEAAKPAEPGKDGAPAAEAPAPIEYAFSFPEGIKADAVDKERMSAFTGILNDSRVAPEKAQALLDLHLTEVGEATKQLAQRQWDVFNDQQNKWREDVMAHPVLGGARHQTAIREIMSVVDSYGGDAQERQALLDVFRTTGVANNPTFLMFLQRASVDLTREAVPHPAPPPRTQAPSREQRGLNRYAKTTPVNGR